MSSNSFTTPLPKQLTASRSQVSWLQRTSLLDPDISWAVGAAIFQTSIHGSLLRPYKLLIIRRSASEPSFPNVWEVPSGHVEKTDHIIAHTLVREVREETGLRICSIKTNLSDYTWDTPEKGIQFNCIVRVYDWENVVLNPEEHQDHRWICEDEADGFEMLEGMRVLIREAFEKAKSLH